MGSPLRRLAAVCLPALLVSAAALAAGSVHTWAQPQIKLVIRQGIFAGTPATFEGSGELRAGALATALTNLTGTPAPTPSDPAAPVSLEQLDRSVVDALGLGDSAYRFYRAAWAAGISVNVLTVPLKKVMATRTSSPPFKRSAPFVRQCGDWLGLAQQYISRTAGMTDKM